MRYIVGDTETAGLGAEKKAVEIALIEIDLDLQAINKWESLIDPGIPINPDAQAIHGISNRDVWAAPTSEEFIETTLGGRLSDDICLIGHNISFDLDMLTCIGNITQTVCTLDMARTYSQGQENNKLQTLREFFGIPENAAHRAMGDAEVCLELLKKLLPKTGRTLPDFGATDSRVIHTMPFGKHAGQLLVSLPKKYLLWLSKLPDLDKNLAESVNQAILLKD
jgi:exodeoxyribonuclease X